MKHNRESLSTAFAILNRALRPFVELHLRRAFGDDWESAAKRRTSVEHGNRPLDLAALLSAIHNNKPLFVSSLSHIGQAYTSEMREFRNRWAHQEPIGEEDADRALDTASRLLCCIGADVEQREIESLRGVGAPPLLNGLVQIGRTDRHGGYTEESLDYEAAGKNGNYLKFKSYDSHGQVVNVMVHVDVVIEGAFGEISADYGFDRNEDVK